MKLLITLYNKKYKYFIHIIASPFITTEKSKLTNKEYFHIFEYKRTTDEDAEEMMYFKEDFDIIDIEPYDTSDMMINFGVNNND